MAQSTVLVTGGAGYIGSHVVLQLRERGEKVVVLDSLVTGFRQAVGDVPMVVGDVGDRELVGRLLREHGIDTVMHFAAHTIEPESVRNPLKYYGNNTCSTRSLLQSCAEAGVRHFVFSSTAAVYGVLDTGYASEDTATAPINPYGTSKLMSEWMLRDLSFATGLRHVVLRYFNVAGSDPQGRIGQSTREATLLIKVAAEAAAGKRPGLSMFGTDYPTPDGTGIRDYIHVEDLARGHLAALQFLERNQGTHVHNLGTGRGYSVLEVVNAFERASGRTVPYQVTDRRPGDIAACWADTAKAAQELGWHAELDLEAMCTDAWRWQARNPNGFRQ
jgi:UDP-glucose 4-epimerase